MVVWYIFDLYQNSTLMSDPFLQICDNKRLTCRLSFKEEQINKHTYSGMSK